MSKLALLTLLLTACTTGPLDGDGEDSPDAGPPSISARVDAVMQAYQAAHPEFVGAAVVVIDHGQVAHLTYGVANKTTMTPFDDRTLFGIGSITKTFTALLLAYADAQGTVHLGDAVGPYIGMCAASNVCPKYSFTFEQLADYYSGLPRQITYSGSAKDLYTSVNVCTSCVAPETQFIYSNYGFQVLGSVLADHLQGTWQDVNARIITRPLGLGDTMVPGGFATGDFDARRAHSYDVNGAELAAPGPGLDTHAAAGMLFSTLPDMETWLRFHMGLLDTAPSQLASLLPVMRASRPGHATVGLGWRFKSLAFADGSSHRIMYKPGDFSGFHSNILAAGGQSGVFVVVNFDSPAPAADDDTAGSLGEQIMAHFPVTPVTPVKTVRGAGN